MTRTTDAFTVQCEDCGAVESFISHAERTPASMGWTQYESERFLRCGRHMKKGKHDLCPECSDAMKTAFEIASRT